MYSYITRSNFVDIERLLGVQFNYNNYDTIKYDNINKPDNSMIDISMYKKYNGININETVVYHRLKHDKIKNYFHCKSKFMLIENPNEDNFNFLGNHKIKSKELVEYLGKTYFKNKLYRLLNHNNKQGVNIKIGFLYLYFEGNINDEKMNIDEKSVKFFYKSLIGNSMKTAINEEEDNLLYYINKDLEKRSLPELSEDNIEYLISIVEMQNL